MADPTLEEVERNLELARTSMALGEELFAQCDESDPNYLVHLHDLREDRQDIARLEALRDKLRSQSANVDPSHPLNLYESLVAGTR